MHEVHSSSMCCKFVKGGLGLTYLQDAPLSSERHYCTQAVYRSCGQGGLTLRIKRTTRFLKFSWKRQDNTAQPSNERVTKISVFSSSPDLFLHLLMSSGNIVTAP